MKERQCMELKHLKQNGKSGENLGLVREQKFQRDRKKKRSKSKTFHVSRHFYIISCYIAV